MKKLLLSLFLFGGCLQPGPSIEICDDTLDNDGDTLIDCNDSDCVNERECAVERCDNLLDDDQDKLADCDDPDCVSDPLCQPAEVCGNGADDDQDSLIDCNDPDCDGRIQCQPESNCNNNDDDDLDGEIDCQDTDCASVCVDEVCNNGADDDLNSLTDCDDPDCTLFVECLLETQCGFGGAVCCNDGLDNNLNGLSDCDDPACENICAGLFCGNDIVENEELCDDGNTEDGDCCAADCSQITCEAETEPNNTATEASGPFQVNSFVAGAIEPSGDLDFFSFEVEVQSQIKVETSDENGLGSCLNVDTRLSLFDTNGTGLIATDDNSGFGSCSLFTTSILQPGVYFIRVESANAAQQPPYRLHVSSVGCGNALTNTNEECDDGSHCEDLTPCISNAQCAGIGNSLCQPRSGDGCTASCVSEGICGDGLLTFPPEECDDGNTISGDGCDANCTVSTCGNEIATPGEECDDGNLAAGDGCDPNCTLSICGNGIAGGAEQCDLSDLQGASCVSLGFAFGSLSCDGACNFNTTACVASVCGNGSTETGEECDDGNLINGDGCTADCLFEIALESEPNNIIAQATGPFGSPFLAEGSINVNNDVDFYSFTLSAPGSLQIETFDGNGPSTCEGGIATSIELRAPDGSTLLASDSASGPNSCSFIGPTAPGNDAGARNLTPGTYFIRVIESGQNAIINTYRLRVSLASLCGNNVVEVAGQEGCDDGNLVAGDGCDNLCRTEICGNNRIDANEQCEDGNTSSGDCCSATCQIEPECTFEAESNNTTATANGPITDGSKIAADISPNADVDFFSLVLPARVDLRLETQNLIDSNCSTTQDTILEFIAPNGTTSIAINNDFSATNRCSRLDGTLGAVGSLSQMRNLPPGTYFIKVSENGNNSQINDYRLLVRFVSLCGDGLQENSEPCDDGNQIAGDGCENDCTFTPACGNNVVEVGEECDGGNNIPGDGCDSLCQREPLCSDGFIDAPETCDDGNIVNADCCSSACQIEAGCTAEIEPNGSTSTATGPLTADVTPFASINPTGDADFYSLTIPAEADVRIETVNITSTNCLASQDTFLRFFAPDGTTLATNNDISGVNRCSRLDPAINAQMRNLAPGNYFFSVEENGGNAPIAHYRVFISFSSLCGNNTQEPNELCDDGNLIDGDGCESDCTLPPVCGNNIPEAGEACDSGAFNSDTAPDACRLDCSLPSCGDSTIDSNEACDDGNLALGDGCDASCQIE